jgi:S-disulfanyl-L-cysteine oxidoreductase SoxD
MSQLKWIIPLALSIGGIGASAADLQPEPNFGAPVTEEELARYLAIPPSGTGLPPGRGDVAQGKEVYAAKCAACHGEHLEGVKETGGVALAGGRGSLASSKPMKTVESYWPYATTVFDYVKRAMPFNAPGSLTDDEVYAVTAYILANAHVVPENAILDAASLPKVEMPNRNGFYPDPRPK